MLVRAGGAALTAVLLADAPFLALFDVSRPSRSCACEDRVWRVGVVGLGMPAEERVDRGIMRIVLVLLVRPLGFVRIDKRVDSYEGSKGLFGLMCVVRERQVEESHW